MDQAGLQPTTGFLAAAPREEDEKIKASGSDGSVRHEHSLFLLALFVFRVSRVCSLVCCKSNVV
jgi:hypothetical protein